MALPFGISWICTLLLWGCLRFPPLNGYNIAHGYSLNDDEISSYASPQTSTQFTSGVNHDSVSPRDKIQDMQHQNFVPFQREPALHEYKEDVISVTSSGEDMQVQSEMDSEQHGATPTPIVQKNEQVSSGHQHPFGLLLKEHTQKDHGEPVEGISFPTIEDVKIFIESMKSSFLIPGSDLSKHFQTAQQTLENEIASGAQNIKGESLDPVEEGSAHDDGSENEVWSEPMNSAFEQSKQGGNYETASESLPVSDPVISTTGLIFPRAYESQDSGLGSYLYPSPQFAVTEHVPSNYGHFSNAVLGETPDFLTYPPDEQNEDVQSTSYILPEQIPFSSNSLYGEDFSFRAHVTDSPLNPPDLRYYSRKTSSIVPVISDQTSQQPKYISHSEDRVSTGYEKPSDFDLQEYFQRENLGKMTPEKPQSSYGKSFYISAPRVQYPDLQPTHGERPAPLLQTYPLTAGKEFNDINFSPSVHLPVSSVSVSSSSDTLSPLRSSGQVGVQTSSPLDPQNQVFSRKQPVKSHLMFTAKPSSSPEGSSRHNDHLGDQSVSVNHPSVFNSQAKDLSKQTLFSAIQEPKHMIKNIQSPFSNGLDLSFNSVANLAPTSKSKKASSRLVDEVMSRQFETQNMISDMFPTGVYGARNPSDLFSTSLRPGISLNKGYLRATRAGLLQSFIQPPKEQKRPANVNKKPGKLPKRPFKPMSTANVFGATLRSILWGNDGYRKRPPRQAGPKVSPPSVNAYIVKSRNGYVRGKVSLSKTSYTPHLMTEGRAGNDQKKPA